MLLIDGYCGVRMGDGREFVLLPAVTPGAWGRVPHTIAYDKTSKVAFVIAPKESSERKHGLAIPITPYGACSPWRLTGATTSGPRWG